MIRHFQEMYFEEKYYYTVKDRGYTTPNFIRVAEAYGIAGKRLHDIDEIKTMELVEGQPEVFEVVLKGDTYVFPKLEFGKPNQDQEPLLDRELYNYLMEL